MDVVVHSDCPRSLHTVSPLKGHANFYLNILKCLGYEEYAPPVADLLRAYHGLQGQWLVATPIYWQATHNDAMIMACSGLMNWSEVESRASFKLFSDFIASEGMETYFHDPYTWLIQCEGKPPIHARPPHSLLHQSMFHHLKSLDPTGFWQRFMTEVQMLLNGKSHASTMNGVWVWGSGELEPPTTRKILVDNPAQYHLARLLSSNLDYFWKHGPSIEKNALILFDTMDMDERESIAQQLKHCHVNWYWDNCAYYSRKSSWFSKFLSFK